MTKVLRKYRTWFLALFGSFLMVSFLLTGPSSLFHPDPLKQVEGTLAGEKVRMKDGIEAAGELDAVKLVVGDGLIERQLRIENGVHWLMLTREAQRAGLVGLEQDGRESLGEIARGLVPAVVRERTIMDMQQNQPQLWDIARRSPQLLEQFVQQQVQQLTPSDYDMIATDVSRQMEASLNVAGGRSGLSPDKVALALAKLRGVIRLQNSYLRAARMSDRRFVSASRDQIDTVLADCVVIPGMTFADPAYAPTAEEVLAQFEKFKTIAPGTGDAGIGYQLPARIKLEWIALERQTLADAIQVGLKDVSKHWQQNRSRFPGELEAERANVEGELKQVRVEVAFSEMNRAWQARVKSDLRRVQTVQGVRTLPSDWLSTRSTMAGYAQAMGEAASTSLGSTIPAPTVQSRTASWLPVAQAGSLPGVGQAEYNAGARTFPLPAYLAQVYEISKDSNLGVQVGVPVESPLVDAMGNRYYLVVTDARGPSAPDSVDEVRDQVVRHLREQRGFETAQARLTEFQAQAAGIGLDAMVEEVNASIADPSVTRLSVLRNVRFSRASTDRQLRMARPESTRDEVLKIANALGALTQATAENQALRTGGASSAMDRAVVVFQVNGVDPVTREDLQLASPAFVERLSAQELASVEDTTNAVDAFTFEATSRRMQWKPAGQQQETSGQAPNQAPSQAPGQAPGQPQGQGPGPAPQAK